MAEKERNEVNDAFLEEPEGRTRSLQRTGNFRKNVRRKYSAQQSDPGHAQRKMSSSAETGSAMKKSSTLPDMPRYGSRGSISSENSSDSSYTSLDNSLSSDKSERNSSTSSDISSEVNYDVTDAFEQSAILDLRKQTFHTLETIPQEKEPNYANNCDNPNKQSNNLNSVTLEQNQKANGLNQSDSTNKTFHQNELTNKDPETTPLDEPLQVIGSAAASIGVDLARGVGLLGKVAADAWDFFSSTLDNLVPGDSDSGSDVSWHDAGSDVSDDDADFVDANEDQRPRDRIHHICNELLTTEESYVERLQVLVKVRQKTRTLLGADVARQMFHDIETINTFHSDYLLLTLRDRLRKWPAIFVYLHQSKIEN